MYYRGDIPETSIRILWFLVYAVGGTLAAAGVLGGFGLLLFVLPVGGLVMLLAARMSRGGPEWLGMLVGIAVLFLFLGYRSTQPPHLSPSSRDLAAPFLTFNTLLLAGGVGGYVWQRRR